MLKKIQERRGKLDISRKKFEYYFSQTKAIFIEYFIHNDARKHYNTHTCTRSSPLYVLSGVYPYSYPLPIIELKSDINFIGESSYTFSFYDHLIF